MSLFLQQPRSATIRAVVYCDVYELKKEDLDFLVERFPSLGVRRMKSNLISLLSLLPFKEALTRTMEDRLNTTSELSGLRAKAVAAQESRRSSLHMMEEEGTEEAETTHAATKENMRNLFAKVVSRASESSQHDDNDDDDEHDDEHDGEHHHHHHENQGGKHGLRHRQPSNEEQQKN